MRKNQFWQDLLTGVFAALGIYGVYKLVKKENWSPRGAIGSSIVGALTTPAIAPTIRKIVENLKGKQQRGVTKPLFLPQGSLDEKRVRNEQNFSSKRLTQPAAPVKANPSGEQINRQMVQEVVEDVRRKLKDINRRYKRDEFANTWLSILKRGSIILITGRRGSGKSSAGHKMLEYTESRGTCYVVGFPRQGRKELPAWIGITPEISEAPPRATILVEEGSLLLSSRESMSQRNRDLLSDIVLARQRGHTLIIISQDSSYIDKNILRSIDTLIIKEPAPLQITMDRPEIRVYLEKAAQAFQGTEGDKRTFCYVAFSPSGFTGMLPISKADHWNERLSNIYASGVDLGRGREAKTLSKEEKKKLALKRHEEGKSVREIGRELGVSKSTVWNWIQHQKAEQEKGLQGIHQSLPSLDTLIRKARGALK